MIDTVTKTMSPRVDTSHVMASVMQGIGITLVTGKSGLGKSMLLKDLSQYQLFQDATYIDFSRFDRGGLLGLLTSQWLGDQVGTKTIRECLQQSQDKRVVVIDGATHFTTQDWQDVVDLIALSSQCGTPVQCVVAVDHLPGELSEYSNKQEVPLAQLSGSRLVDHIQQELSQRGHQSPVYMSLCSVGLIGWYTAGLPRRVNHLLSQCVPREKTQVSITTLTVLMAMMTNNSGFNGFHINKMMINTRTSLRALPLYVWLIGFVIVQLYLMGVTIRPATADLVGLPEMRDAASEASVLPVKNLTDDLLNLDHYSANDFIFESSQSTIKDSLQDAIVRQEATEIDALLKHSTEDEFAENFAMLEPILNKDVSWIDGESLCQHSVDSIKAPQVVMTCSAWMIDRGQYKKALGLFVLPITNVADHADYFERKAYLLLKIGRSKEAVEHYQRLLSVNQNNAAWWLGLGSAYKVMGSTIEAGDAFQKALAQAPKTAGYKAFLMREING